MTLAYVPRPRADAESVARVLTEIAEIASETFELRDVFDRVAASIRRVLPFEHMGVVRILDGDWAVKHATTLVPDTCTECSAPFLLSAFSPRLRPRPGPIVRIDDAANELDAAFPVDQDIIASGVRSVLWEPFRSRESFTGGVWVTAREPHAFSDEHQATLKPIAALLGSAVEHWRIWDLERRRRERLDQLESLLGTLAESLDIRAIFERLSRAIQPILPHDLLSLTELDVRAATIRVVAIAGSADIDPPTQTVALTPAEIDRRAQEFEIFHDIPSEVRRTPSATG
jgi:GAF domain-containing protein